MIELDEFHQLHDANSANIEEFIAAERHFWDAYNENKRRNGRGSFRAFPADDALYRAHMQRKAAFYKMLLTDVAHAKHAEVHGFDRSSMPVTRYSHYRREAEKIEEWKAQQNAANGREYLYDPNPSMNEDYHFNKAKRLLSVFTGRYTNDVERRARALMKEGGMERDESMQELWATPTLSQDKPSVFIDSEIACRSHDDIGTVDTPTSSSSI